MNTKLAGLALVIGSIFLAPSYAEAQFRRNRAPDTQKYTAPVQADTSPVAQEYDAKIVIREQEKEIFKGYLEKRVKTSKEISDILTRQYMAGVITFDDMNSQSSTHLVYESALEAIASGDRNVYDMILKHTAWRNDILIGLKPELLKKNLDKKYAIAKAIFQFTETRYRMGFRASVRDLLTSRGTLEDLEFLYKIMNIKPYEEPKPEHPKKENLEPMPEELPFPKLPKDLILPEIPKEATPEPK